MHSSRRETGASCDGLSDQVRAGHESQDDQCARAHRAGTALTRADEVSECHSRRRDCDPLPQTIRRLEVLSEASDKKHCSVVVAHSHLADFSSQVRADGRRISAVVAGCYSRQVESMSRQETVIAEMILIFNPPRNYRTSSGST